GIATSEPHLQDRLKTWQLFCTGSVESKSAIEFFKLQAQRCINWKLFQRIRLGHFATGTNLKKHWVPINKWHVLTDAQAEAILDELSVAWKRKDWNTLLEIFHTPQQIKTYSIPP
ncbi:hypothetical protein JCM10207_005714, partial [Rhodosporidiobolus poonsookiae]